MTQYLQSGDIFNHLENFSPGYTNKLIERAASQSTPHPQAIPEVHNLLR